MGMGTATYFDLVDRGFLRLYMVNSPAVAAVAITGKDITSMLTSRVCSALLVI